MKKRKLTKAERQVDRLQQLSAAAYQAVGALAYQCGMFDEPSVIRHLDALARCKLPRKTLPTLRFRQNEAVLVLRARGKHLVITSPHVDGMYIASRNHAKALADVLPVMKFLATKGQVHEPFAKAMGFKFARRKRPVVE